MAVVALMANQFRRIGSLDLFAPSTDQRCRVALQVPSLSRRVLAVLVNASFSLRFAVYKGTFPTCDIVGRKSRGVSIAYYH